MKTLSSRCLSNYALNSAINFENCKKKVVTGVSCVNFVQETHLKRNLSVVCSKSMVSESAEKDNITELTRNGLQS